MAWTATLKDAKDRNSHWKITVEFTDGVRTAERVYRFTGSTAAQLKAFVRRQALEFESSDGIDLIPLINQSIDVTPPVPDPPDPPTQEEIDRDAWLDDFFELERIQRIIAAVPALDTGQTQARVTQLRNSLETNFDNSYRDYV